MQTNHQAKYHSDSVTTRIILAVNKRLNHINPAKIDSVRKSSEENSTSRERTPYFGFAYEFTLMLTSICLVPAIIISVITTGLFPYMFNIVSSTMYIMGGISCGWSIMFYKKQEQSISEENYESAQCFVHFSKKDLFRSAIIGGLLGIIWAVLFYWLGIWIHSHPRGGS